MKNPSSQDSKNETIPPAEWIVAAIGLALLILSTGFLFYKGSMVEKSDPRIVFQAERIVSQDGGVLVLAKATNTGGKTVTKFQITGAVGTETHEVVIDFIPAKSSRNFGMFFSTHATRDDVRFAAGAYQEP